MLSRERREGEKAMARAGAAAVRLARAALGGGIGAYALPAAVLLAVTLGQRSSFGLFLSSMNTATGIGFALLSLALAIGQVAWGLSQPAVGALAERYGAARVIAAGGALSALMHVLTVFATHVAAMIAAFGLGGAAGAAAGGAPLLLGLVAQRVAASRRGLASGIVGAGGSAGQFLIAPVAQTAISAAGWVSAMLLMALMSLAVIPFARAFRVRRKQGAAPIEPPASAAADRKARRAARRAALCDPAYWLVAGGFTACGFHVGVLTAHMPGVIERCGMPASLAGTWLALLGACNIAGSIVSGVLTRGRSLPRMLGVLYAARAAGVLVFVAAPKTPEMLLVFAVWMGATYMATVPPTTGFLAQRWGAENLTALFGTTMILHQCGSALGVWLGGVVVESTGRYDALWSIDAALALLAVALHLPLVAGGARRNRQQVLDDGAHAPPVRALPENAAAPVAAREAVV